MMAVLLRLVVALAACTYSTGTTTVCPVNKLQFLSYNASLLPRDNVQASSESSSNPLDHFIQSNSQPWCSDFNDVYDPNLHINFTFTEPVVITFLQSSGFFNNFVDRFSIQYTLGVEGGMFMPYGVLQVPQVFHVDRGPNFFPDEYFSLEQQLVAQRIRLDIHQSVFDISNRSCWSLMLLGCTFKEAMSIVEEEVIQDNNSTKDEPCLVTTTVTRGVMVMNTPHPEPTGLSPSGRPCTLPTDTSTDSAMTTERALTIIVPVAGITIALCAVIVGFGVLCCYIIVARNSNGKSYSEGVTVKVIGHRNVPVPMEPGNEQKPFVVNGTMSSRKDSVCSESDSFHYDMPRPTTYDIPRTPSQRPRAGTLTSNEYRNPIYDGRVPKPPSNLIPIVSTKESNTYESIPYDLEQRTRAASESQTGTRVRRASDMLPRPHLMAPQLDEAYTALHSSDPQMVQYSVVDKSKKTVKEAAVPVFESLYDQSSRDDIDTPVSS